MRMTESVPTSSTTIVKAETAVIPPSSPTAAPTPTPVPVLSVDTPTPLPTPALLPTATPPPSGVQAKSVDPPAPLASSRAPLSSDDLNAILHALGVPRERWESFNIVVFGGPNCRNGESGGSPGVVGDHGSALGLFQIHPEYHQPKLDRLFKDGVVMNEDWLDPYTNTAVAVAISGGGLDWSAWSCRP